MSDKPIPSETVEARHINVGDRISWTSRIWTVKSISLDTYEDGRGGTFAPGFVFVLDDDGKDKPILFGKNELVARILPDPLEVREFWRVAFVRYHRPTDGTDYNQERLKSCGNRDTVINLLNDQDFTDAVIEHVRETVLSREEVKP